MCIRDRHRLDPDLPLPAYAHPGDAGVDLFARVDVLLAPGQRALVPTGIAIALPEGYAAFGHPRSGLAIRHGITILNAPGTIDSGYRGEIFVNLVNLDASESFQVSRGDRIAQLVVQRVEAVQWVEAVSYTHLDVYKRQAEGGEETASTEPGAWAGMANGRRWGVRTAGSRVHSRGVPEGTFVPGSGSMRSFRRR